MMNSVHKSLFFHVILASLALAGCVSNEPKGAVDWDFWASGKLAVRDAAGGHSARFNWRQLGGRYDIEVWGPLGQGRTQLFGDNQQMTVTRGERVLDKGHPHEVMGRHLGWTFPVDALPAWLRGEPYSALALSLVSQDGDGRIDGFHQAGWTVDFERFIAYEQGIRPGRITATRGDYRVRVVVNEYLGPKKGGQVQFSGWSADSEYGQVGN
jgi:outer membrane lipoprotein LolB